MSTTRTKSKLFVKYTLHIKGPKKKTGKKVFTVQTSKYIKFLRVSPQFLAVTLTIYTHNNTTQLYITAQSHSNEINQVERKCIKIQKKKGDKNPLRLYINTLITTCRNAPHIIKTTKTTLNTKTKLLFLGCFYLSLGKTGVHTTKPASILLSRHLELRFSNFGIV